MQQPFLMRSILPILAIVALLALPVGPAAAASRPVLLPVSQAAAGLRPGGSASLAAPTGALSDTADLALTMADWPDPVIAGSTLTYTLNVTNNGTSAISPSVQYSNPATLTIPTSGKATSYPSTLTVSGWSGQVTRVRVTLNQVSHTNPDDLDMLLVGPQGQKVMLMSDVGGNTDLVNTTLIFDDLAPAMPDDAVISAGTYRPTDTGTTDTLPSPAPGRPYATALSAFNGVDPNGAWSLYVNDDSSPNSGTIQGWSLALINENDGGVLSDPLPSGATFISASGSNWDCFYASGSVTCLPLVLPVGALPPVTVKVTATGSSGTLTNTATISGGTFDPNLSNNSATAITTVTPRADLALTKTAASTLATSGGAFTYTLTVANSGPSAATAITLTDALPAELSLLSAAGSGWSCVGSPTVSCTLPSLASGSTSAVSLVAQVANTTATITNTASVAAATGDSVSANNSASLAIQPYPPLDLRIAKTASASQAYAGKALTYTLSLTNTSTTSIGSGSSYQNPATVVIPASGKAAPYPSTLTVSGWSGPVGKVKVTLSQVSHTYPDDLDVLLVGPQGQAAMLMSDVGSGDDLVNATLIFDDSGPALPDAAPISSGIYRPTDMDASEIQPSPAPGRPYATALSAFSGVDPNGVWSLYVNDDAGGDLGTIQGWSLSLLSSETGVAVSDPLPSGATFVSASGSDWTCSYASGAVTCQPLSVPVGALPPITVTTLAPQTTGSITNTATVSSTVNDTNPSDNTASVTTQVIDSDNLSVTSAADPSPAQAGARLVYTLNVTNLDTNMATSLVVTDTLPAGATLLNASGSGWSCAGAATLSCTRPTLGAGASSSISLVLRAPSATATLTNAATVSSYWADSDPSNNSSVLATEVVQRGADFIEIASPLYGAALSASTPITISGTASDLDGIQSVTLLIDGAVLETLPFNGAAVATDWASSLAWAPPAPGTYAIAAVLLDSSGSRITDTIQVRRDPAAAPGGVADILTLWLKADEGLSLASGALTVTGWLDQSGNGQHLAQAAAANRPAYQAAAINGNPLVRFDTSDYLTRTIKGSALFAAESASILFAKQSVSGGVWFKWETGNGNRVGFELSGTAARFDMATDGSGRLDGVTKITDAFHLISGVKSASTQSLYVDGRTDVSKSNNSILTTTSTSNLTLGKQPDGSLGWNGTIAEVIVFGRALSSAEQARVESYMAIKYGTTLLSAASTGRSYVDSSGATIWDAAAMSAYHHDVAGIGRDDASALRQLQSRSINGDAVVTVTNGNSSAAPASIASDRSFLIWGNDDAAATAVITGSLGSGQYRRMARVWRAQETGAVGETSVSFDLSGLGLAVNPAATALLVSDNAGFQNATAHTTGRSVNGTTVSFDHVDFSSGAYFTLLLNQATLSVAISGPGSVSSQPAGIDCGATCAAGYAFSTPVTLTAQAAGGATFLGWGGDCAGAALTCVVSVDQPRSATAAFCPGTVSVSSSSDSGPGSLREAIGTVCDGGTITFANSSAIYLDSSLNLTRTLTIDGGGQAVTISGDSGNDGSRNIRPFTIAATAAVTLTGLTVVDGSALEGGAIFSQGRLTILSSSFARNRSQNSGGAVYAEIGTLTVSQTTFFSNTSGVNGGGLWTESSTVTIANSTFAQNSSANGGGFATFASDVILTHTTFSGNAAPVGAGFLNKSITPIRLRNSIIANSSGGADCQGSLSENTQSLIEDGTCGPALTGDPALAALGDYGGATQTFALLPGSPALDAASAGFCLGADQRGQARPQGAGCDLGAFESRGFTLSAVSGGGQTTALSATFPGPLVVRLSALDTGLDVGAGHVITFSAPLSGASLSTPVLTATTSPTGTASVSVSANAIEGSYVVNATTPSASAPASFALTQFAGRMLTVSRSGTGSGTVASNPAGIACGSACAAAFGYGAVVTLTATADAGSAFAGWDGACTGAASTCVVTLDQARAVGARFERTRFRIFLPRISR